MDNSNVQLFLCPISDTHGPGAFLTLTENLNPMLNSIHMGLMNHLRNIWGTTWVIESKELKLTAINILYGEVIMDIKTTYE